MDARTVLMEALASLLPDTDEGKAALKSLEEAVASLEQSHQAEIEDINKQIEEQYAIAADMIKETEKQAYAGYEEAAQIIDGLKQELNEAVAQATEDVKSEAQRQAYEGYEQAAQMIDDLKRKNDSLDLELREYYETKLAEQREHLIDQIDAFFAAKSNEVYDYIKNEVMTDPAIATEANALRRVQAIVTETLGLPEFTAAIATPEAGVTTSPAAATAEEAEKLKEDLAEHRAQARRAEARNTRLQVENTRLVREAREARELADRLLAESTKGEEPNVISEVTEQPEIQAESTETVEGRGQVVAIEDIIPEAAAPTAGDGVENKETAVRANATDNGTEIAPGLTVESFAVLAGIQRKNR